MIIVLTTTLPARGIQMVIDPTRYGRMAELLRVTECCLREDREAEKRWVRESEARAFLIDRIDPVPQSGRRAPK
ncbi:hypothetical protein T4B_5845 [Trichinella pseudospiralis]|uniref:Uncharacterized protein n=1 Tax=Trichinella pseudospiralis TaxID=6337 RepID=A0A0V1GLK0_TRIPS|nr:hypothetical protein T4B_5845 [Trichinella pseudospiralis]